MLSFARLSPAVLASLALSAPTLASDTPVDDDATDEGLVPTGRDKPAQRPRVEPTPTTPELAKPEISPEARRTVEAFEGKWDVAGMSTDDAGNPMQVTASIECAEVAEGAAVACDATFVEPDGTEDVRHVVWTVDPASAEVHRIVVSARGIEDDTGKWVGDELVIETAPAEGADVEKTTVVIAEDGTMRQRTVRKTAQGEQLVREVTGKRDVADEVPELPMNDVELPKEPIVEPPPR